MKSMLRKAIFKLRNSCGVGSCVYPAIDNSCKVYPSC